MLAVPLAVSIIPFSVLQECVTAGIRGLLERHLDVERVSSREGISLHRGKYGQKESKAGFPSLP